MDTPQYKSRFVAFCLFLEFVKVLFGFVQQFKHVESQRLFGRFVEGFFQFLDIKLMAQFDDSDDGLLGITKIFDKIHGAFNARFEITRA